MAGPLKRFWDTTRRACHADGDRYLGSFGHFLREPERRTFINAIETADSTRMSVAGFVESSMVIESRYGAEGLRDLDRFISRANIELMAVDGEQGLLARSAFSRFGKGRHRAGLNYGDCFSYAAAMSLGETLLCKGDDFIHTDVPVFDAQNGRLHEN